MTRHRVLGAFVALGVAFVATSIGPVAARAEEPPAEPLASSTSMRYQVTFAARACSTYAEVMANRVRDDSAEAPVSPGRDSAYRDGQGVDPDVEAANSADCAPLNGWRFTLGGSPTRKGPLSVVTGAPSDSGPAGSDTPRLDTSGRPTGKSIAGAVTVTLTDAQVTAATGRKLWAQGGTPDDPLLARSLPGYGFGVLRCGYDGRVDANVQWIGFPAGVRHVFCFAYYVQSAKPTGTLIVRAKPTRALGYAQRFTFDASPSYAPDKRITLASAGAPADASLVRTAGGAPSQIVARVPVGWRLADLSCAKTGSGASVATTDLATATANVTLSPGEIVACTYTFDPPVTATGLTLRVYTDRAGGTFGLTLDGDGGARTLSASPAGDGSAALATGADLTTLTPGQYTVTLTPPGGQADVWSLTGVYCGAEVKPDGLTATLTLAIDKPLDCVLRVARKAGSLDLRAVTVGAVGSIAFIVTPLSGSTGWAPIATTTGFGVPTPAEGDLPAALDFGSYLIMPLAPKSTVEGTWKLTSLACDPGEPGTGVVELTLKSTSASCVATMQFVPATRMQVTLRFSGEPAGRSSPAVIEVRCDDGSKGRAVLPAEDLTARSLPVPLAFLDATRCTVDRPFDGAATAASASVSAALTPAPGNAPLSLPATVEIGRDIDEYTIVVTVSYTVTDGAPRQATVLDTFRVLPVALIGAGLVGIGLVILLVMVVRSRTV
jgi:hypothetical protein